VGGSKPVPVDIRIIATSNRNLAEQVKSGGFREDLFYRLNVVHLRLPALRERPADILALAEFFGRKYAELNGVSAREMSDEARRIVTANPWRGNVRELENAMHRAVLLSSGATIDADSLRNSDGETLAMEVDPATRAARTAEAVTRSLVGRTVAEVEQDLILDTLDHCIGNRTHAAKILGISIRTLRNKLNEYASAGVPIPEPGQARQMSA
jgi:two-component system, response regulator FlrC